MTFWQTQECPFIDRVRQGAVSHQIVNKVLRGILNVTNIPTWRPVVALALFDNGGQILLQQRPAGKHHAGCWEFPGGKVENGEKPRDSLVREIAEELAIAIDPGQLCAAFFAEEADENHIVLFLYTSHQRVGQPEGCDGQAWGWFSLEQAARLALAPMDQVLLAQIAATAR